MLSAPRASREKLIQFMMHSYGARRPRLFEDATRLFGPDWFNDDQLRDLVARVQSNDRFAARLNRQNRERHARVTG